MAKGRADAMALIGADPGARPLPLRALRQVKTPVRCRMATDRGRHPRAVFGWSPQRGAKTGWPSGYPSVFRRRTSLDADALLILRAAASSAKVIHWPPSSASIRPSDYLIGLSAGCARSRATFRSIGLRSARFGFGQPAGRNRTGAVWTTAFSPDKPPSASTTWRTPRIVTSDAGS